MSEFWFWWEHAQESPVSLDVWHVNIIVAQRVGYTLELFDDRLLFTYRLKSPMGEVHHFEIVVNDIEVAWIEALRLKLIPHYMTDLAAAVSLPRPVSKYGNPVHIQTTEWDNQTLVEIYEEFDQNILPDDNFGCVSVFTANARVGAWWAATTGERQPTDNG